MQVGMKAILALNHWGEHSQRAASVDVGVVKTGANICLMVLSAHYLSLLTNM